MAEVNWILKLGTHRSPYLHSPPPTSPPQPAKPHDWMSPWDGQSAYCTYGPPPLHRALAAAVWFSRRGLVDRGASVTFSVGSLATEDLSPFLSNWLFLFLLLLLFCFTNFFPQRISIQGLGWSNSTRIKFYLPDSIHLMGRTLADIPGCWVPL